MRWTLQRCSGMNFAPFTHGAPRLCLFQQYSTNTQMKMALTGQERITDFMAFCCWYLWEMCAEEENPTNHDISFPMLASCLLEKASDAIPRKYKEWVLQEMKVMKENSQRYPQNLSLKIDAICSVSHIQCVCMHVCLCVRAIVYLDKHLKEPSLLCRRNIYRSVPWALLLGVQHLSKRQHRIENMFNYLPSQIMIS